MKIALAVAAMLVIALFVAARVPKTAAYLQDVPVLEYLVDWIGPHDSLPAEVELGFDHRPAPEELAHARSVLASRVAPQTVAIYELEATPTEVPLARLQFGNGEVLVPLPAAPAPDTEIVVET